MKIEWAEGMRARLVAAFFIFFISGMGAHWSCGRGWRGLWLSMTRDYREKIQLRTIGATIPFAVLSEIHRAGEDVPAILALIMCESSGRPQAQVVDPKGTVIARGLIMVRPQHAVDRGYTERDLFDPVVNVRLGIEVLKEIRTRWPDEEGSVSVYNCGDAAWKRAKDTGEKPPAETRGHWRKYQEYRDAYRYYINTGEGLE